MCKGGESAKKELKEKKRENSNLCLNVFYGQGFE